MAPCGWKPARWLQVWSNCADNDEGVVRLPRYGDSDSAPLQCTGPQLLHDAVLRFSSPPCMCVSGPDNTGHTRSYTTFMTDSCACHQQVSESPHTMMVFSRHHGMRSCA